MRFQETVDKFEKIADGFRDATTSLTQIFSDLKLISDVSIGDGAPSTSKFAASAAIISELEIVMQQAANPDAVEVAIQLAKIGPKVRIALPGGAVMSNEELNWVATNIDTYAPPNLFYVLAQEQLLSGAELGFNYDLNLASSNFTQSLRTNLKRELGEELGEEAASKVTVNSFLPGERVTTLSTLKLPNVDFSKIIAERLESRGVTCAEDGTLKGIYTKVTEKVAVAHGPLTDIENLATANLEAKGMRVKTLGELLDISKKSSESVQAFSDFKQHHSERHGSDGIRNPSTTWGLGLLATWLKEQVISADTYKL
jgi:8-oxo-dGTP pyrophosphatase MutT (NUDIX family)